MSLAASAPPRIRKGRLPNLLIIGAAKCGTTSLHEYLNLHPEIGMSATKELRFFTHDYLWSKGLSWYASNFKQSARIAGESSTSYTNHLTLTDVPARIAASLPDVRFIYLVRDPVARAVSHYYQAVHDAQETASLNEAMRNALEGRDPAGYIRRSCYASQLRRYLVHFPRERFLLLDSARLASDREQVLKEAFSFLGVDPGFHSEGFAVLHNPRAKRRRPNWLGRRVRELLRSKTALMLLPSDYLRLRIQWRLVRYLSRPMEMQQLAPELESRLAEALRPEAEEFQRLSGLDLRHWSLFRHTGNTPTGATAQAPG